MDKYDLNGQFVLPLLLAFDYHFLTLVDRHLNHQLIMQMLNRRRPHLNSALVNALLVDKDRLN